MPDSTAEYATVPVSSYPLSASIEATLEPHAPAAVKQSTGHPTSKVAAVGIGGGALAVVIGWLQARFGIEFIDEDIALIMLVGPFLVGYFTKEKR